MMTLVFKPTPRVFPDMPMWGAMGTKHTFMISLDDGVYAASAKPVGAKPFDKTRIDLGEFKTYEEAHTACDTFYKTCG
jgi:hypothetical protein